MGWILSRWIYFTYNIIWSRTVSCQTHAFGRVSSFFFLWFSTYYYCFWPTAAKHNQNYFSARFEYRIHRVYSCLLTETRVLVVQSGFELFNYFRIHVIWVPRIKQLWTLKFMISYYRCILFQNQFDLRNAMCTYECTACFQSRKYPVAPNLNSVVWGAKLVCVCVPTTQGQIQGGAIASSIL